MNVIGAPRGSAARSARAVALFLCVLCALLFGAAARAHTALIASEPANNAVLERAPQRLRLSFDEPVAPLVLKIAQPDGSILEPNDVVNQQNDLLIDLAPLSQHGTYVFSWRVVSSDGHPVGGSQIFSINPDAVSSGAAVGAHAIAHSGALASAGLRGPLIWLARLAWLTGLLAGVGMSFFHAFAATKPSSRAHCGFWLLGAAALGAMASLGLLGVDALDAPLADLFKAASWRAAWATSFGAATLLSLLAVGLAALAERAKPGLAKKCLAALALLSLGAALASSGHASSAPPAWLARPALWLHAVAATAWIGALVPLARALGKAPDLNALQSFSRAIPGVLLALVASGALIIYLQFDRPASLWSTVYGQILCAKLILVAVLLAIGAHNRFALTAGVLGGGVAARRKLRRSIWAECLIAVAILAVIALWRFAPPPRTQQAAPANGAVPAAEAGLAAAHADKYRLELRDQKASAQIELRATSLAVELFKPDSTPLAAQELDVVFSNPGAGLEAIRYHATRQTDQSWLITDLRLPKLDNWQLQIEALITDFERLRLQAPLGFAWPP